MKSFGDMVKQAQKLQKQMAEAQAASEKQMNDTLGKLTGGFPLPF